VALAAVVTPAHEAPVRCVIDLSEGGACMEWPIPADVSAGSSVRLSFLLPGDQVVDIDGVCVRAANGRAGVMFSPAQEDAIRQVLAEARWNEEAL
jgi:hypothetical protein